MASEIKVYNIENFLQTKFRLRPRSGVYVALPAEDPRDPSKHGYVISSISDLATWEFVQSTDYSGVIAWKPMINEPYYGDTYKGEGPPSVPLFSVDSRYFFEVLPDNTRDSIDEAIIAGESSNNDTLTSTLDWGPNEPTIYIDQAALNGVSVSLGGAVYIFRNRHQRPGYYSGGTWVEPIDTSTFDFIAWRGAPDIEPIRTYVRVQEWFPPITDTYTRTYEGKVNALQLSGSCVTSTEMLRRIVLNHFQGGPDLVDVSVLTERYTLNTQEGSISYGGGSPIEASLESITETSSPTKQILGYAVQADNNFVMLLKSGLEQSLDHGHQVLGAGMGAGYGMFLGGAVDLETNRMSPPSQFQYFNPNDFIGRYVVAYVWDGTIYAGGSWHTGVLGTPVYAEGYGYAEGYDPLYYPISNWDTPPNTGFPWEASDVRIRSTLTWPSVRTPGGVNPIFRTPMYTTFSENTSSGDTSQNNKLMPKLVYQSLAEVSLPSRTYPSSEVEVSAAMLGYTVATMGALFAISESYGGDSVIRVVFATPPGASPGSCKSHTFTTGQDSTPPDGTTHHYVYTRNPTDNAIAEVVSPVSSTLLHLGTTPIYSIDSITTTQNPDWVWDGQYTLSQDEPLGDVTISVLPPSITELTVTYKVNRMFYLTTDSLYVAPRLVAENPAGVTLPEE